MGFVRRIAVVGAVVGGSLFMSATAASATPFNPDGCGGSSCLGGDGEPGSYTGGSVDYGYELAWAALEGWSGFGLGGGGTHLHL